MKRKQLLLAIAAMLLPMSMVAQTNQTDPYTGLNYLDDGDGKWYINALQTTYFTDQDLRPFWRRAFNNNVTKFYKDDLNGVKVIGLSHTWSGGTATAPNGNSGRQMVFGGIAYFQGLEDLTIKSGSAKSVVLDLSKNKSLKSLTFDQSTIKLQTLNISNTQLTSLTIPTGSASMLESLTMGSVPTLTSLTFGGSNDFTKLSSLDVSETGLTSLNLSLCTALASVKIDKTKLTVGDNLTLPSPSEWIKKKTVGDVETWVRGANITTLTVDAAEEGTTDIDVSAYPKLHTLTVIGATSVKLPSTVNTTNYFTLTMTDSPNATVDWNGREDMLVTLTLNDVGTFDGTGFTSLTTLKYLGSGSKNLKLYAGDNDALTKLDVSKSGITSLDLSGGEAPDLAEFNCWWSDLEYLDLSYHTKLECRTALTTTKLKIIPPYNSGTNYPAGYGIPNNDDGVATYHSKDKLRVIKLRGCTGLGLYNGNPPENSDEEGSVHLWLSPKNVNSNPVIMSALEEVDLSGCTNLKRFECQNSLLKNLNLSECTSLNVISINQGMLTGNGDVNITNCNSLTGLIAHRHQWETLDWLLKDPPFDISNLTQIQVNGGSYTMYGVSGAKNTRYVREVYNEETGQMEPRKYTCRLSELSLSGVSDKFKKLLCEDNLLTTLDLGAAAPHLTLLQCRNNLLTTLDLSGLNHETLFDPDAAEADKYNSRWSPQVGFVPVEIVRGGYQHPEIHGGHDWIALHMENGGYSHKLDNEVGLYNNLYNAMTEGGEKIGAKDYPYMMTVQQAENHADFANDYLCPTNHTGQHIFLQSQADIYNHTGGYKDQDLYGKLLTYKYNTGYNQNKTTNPISGLEDLPDGTPITPEYGPSRYDPHITVRMHIWPFILNVNPASLYTFKKKLENSEEEEEVSFYSSTICLDYDAVIPEGVEVYFVEGLTDPNAVTSALGGYASNPNEENAQFVMNKFGKGGDILPANTPVFVKVANAGLYDFQDAREFVLKGWENLRGDGEEKDHILHGVESNTERNIKSKLETQYNAAVDLKALMMENGGNILTGVYGKRNDASNIYDPLYSTWDETDLTVEKRTVLTLGRQTDKFNTKIMGFWPFNGTKVTHHRCVILESDYNNAVSRAKQKAAEAAAGEEATASSEATPKFSTMGGSFFFVDNIFFSEDVGDANGDGVVSIADVTAIINKINGVVTGKFVEKAADVNKDGIISIADVTGVINTINNQ